MHSSRPSSPPLPGGLGFPLGFLLAIVVTFVAIAAGATTHPQWTVAALAATGAVVACLSTFRATLATAAVCWALHSGFVLGRLGDLVFTPQAARDAVVLCAVATIAFLLATAVRTVRGRRWASTVRIPAQRPGVMTSGSRGRTRAAATR